MSKCEFNKLHFGLGVALYIKLAACIFDICRIYFPINTYGWLLLIQAI